MHQPQPAILREHRVKAQWRRVCGAALLAVAAGGAAWTSHAIGLSQIRLWYAVLLVQGLALAAVTGVALLSIPEPGLARRPRPEA